MVVKAGLLWEYLTGIFQNGLALGVVGPALSGRVLIVKGTGLFEPLCPAVTSEQKDGLVGMPL